MQHCCCCCWYADVFKERLGLVLEREDEIGCAVGGCNFLLRTITHEAFVFEAGQAQFVPCSSESNSVCVAGGRARR
jgi:type II pantothenate kinase